jgi:hypothetical protein
MNVLSLASAFNPGSDLWIVPDFTGSRWAAKIDWYLNFQIASAQRHLSPELRNFTVYVQKETGLDTYQPHLPKTAPLMITSENFFPNKWVVVIPTANDFGHWVRQISDVWENLKHPSLRVFLPTGQNAGSFHKEWQNHHTFEDFTLVLD